MVPGDIGFTGVCMQSVLRKPGSGIVVSVTRNAGFVGTVAVLATVTDGIAEDKKWFVVTFN